MTINDFLNITGIILNLIGAIILALSLNDYFTSIHASIAFLDITFKSFLKSPVTGFVYNVDFAEGLKKGANKSKLKTNIGLIFLILGFVLQAVPYILTLIDKR